MSKINDLRVQRAKTWEDAKAFLDSHRKNGILSAEDTATYEKMEQEIVDLGHEIERQERLDSFEREMNAPTAKPLTGKPETAKTDSKTGLASDEYKAAFWNQVRAKDGIPSAVRDALSEGVDSEGGYLVPDEFEHTLVQALSMNNIVRDHAHVFTTNSGTHKIPVVTSKGTAAWVDEGGTITEADDVFSQQLIGAHKVATIIKVSEELLNDAAFDLEKYFSTEFARRIGNTEEDAFLNGNGVGKPTGIFDKTAGAQIGVTAGSATAITADEIIRKLKDNNGQYLWQPALHEGTFDTLLGKRIFTSPYVPEIGAGKKSIAFGDFSFYWIGDRQGITFRRLNERYAESGQVGFLASKRLDGKLVLPEAIKVLQQKSGSGSGT